MKTNFFPAAREIRRLVTAALAIVGFSALAMPCVAAPGVFMKLEGVEEWSELAGASSDMHASTPSQPVITPGVRISKRIDAISPLLLRTCGDGSLIKRVTLAWRDADGVVFRITLGNVLVRSFRTALQPGTTPLEECAFACDTIEWSWFGHNGRDVLIGGLGADFDVPAQQATEKVYQPFRATLGRIAGRNVLKLTCPVERGRTYRISASTSFDGRWEKLEDFTATDDGEMEKLLTESAGRLFLRVEAVD